jgi:hypothetical protein
MLSGLQWKTVRQVPLQLDFENKINVIEISWTYPS